jgi:hypothetical protein
MGVAMNLLSGLQDAIISCLQRAQELRSQALDARFGVRRVQISKHCDWFLHIVFVKQFM